MFRVKPKRNYKKEHKYDSQPHVKKKRANRNLARRIMKRKGLVKKGDKKDVHHVGGDASNKKSKLKAVPRSKNRSYARTKTARKKNKKS